jgi:single-strand DNA-binding protein
MILTGLARLGRDAEVRYIPSGEAVASLALAFNYGKKQENGNRETQWIEAALWGKQAIALAQYLLKGTLIYAVVEAPHIQTYERTDGTQGFKMIGRLSSLEFAGGKSSDEKSPAAQSQHHTQKADGYQPQKADEGSNWLPESDFNDLIPF